MNLAFGQNDCYLCYILVIWEGQLHVTSKLIEMVQLELGGGNVLIVT